MSVLNNGWMIPHTSAAGLLVPGVSSTQHSVLAWLLCRYLCWGTISTRGIIHPVFSTGTVIVSIPLLGDYLYPGGIIHPLFSTDMVIVSISTEYWVDDTPDTNSPPAEVSTQ
jgi:hypothetical protein